MTGAVTSFAVIVAVQVSMLPEGSATVKVTTCVWLCTTVRTAPAAGLCVTVRLAAAQLSVETICEVMAGTVMVHPLIFTLASTAHVVIAGAATSCTVMTCDCEVDCPHASVAVHVRVIV